MKSTIQTWEYPQPLGNPQMSVSETCWLVVSTVKNMSSSDWDDDSSQYIPWRIHGAAIYGNMDPINIPQSC